MISTIDIEINAANPSLPLTPFKAYVNSPSSIRVRNVPRKVGKWEVTKVFISANYPDNSIKTAECVLTGGVWVGTIAGCASVGRSVNGYQITANGTDENGAPVTGYCLGVGDVEIKSRDATITIGETTYYVHILDAQPQTPKKGDLCKIAGTWKIYTGTAWDTLGGGGGGNITDVKVNGVSVVDSEGVALIDISGKADATALTAEVNRAQAAEALKADQTALTAEVNRATAAEALKRDKTDMTIPAGYDVTIPAGSQKNDKSKYTYEWWDEDEPTGYIVYYDGGRLGFGAAGNQHDDFTVVDDDEGLTYSFTWVSADTIAKTSEVGAAITADVTHAKGASAGGQTASTINANGVLDVSTLFSGDNTSYALDKIRVSESDSTSAKTLVDGKITNPNGGSVGNVLKKTASGVEWGEGSGGSAEYDFKNFNVKFSSSVPREQMYVPNPNWVPVVSNKNTNPATATSTGTHTEWDYDPETEEEIEITVNYTETKNVLTGLTSIGLFNFKKDTSVAHRYNLVAERNGAEYDEEEEEYVFTSTTIAHVDYDPTNQTWSVTRDATSAKHATDASNEEEYNTEDYSVNNLAFSIADGLITVTGNIKVFPSSYLGWQMDGQDPSTPTDTAFTLTYNIGGREGYDMVVAAKVQLFANAINKIVIPADMTSAQKDFDALVILFPTQTSGKVRDFLIRVEQKWSQAIGFTFPTTETRGGTAGQTITYEGDDFVTMATNKNYLFSFTETTSGTFQTKSDELKAQGE